MKLPAPLCPKKRCINKFSMDFAMVRTEIDGVFDIYKHFVSESPGVPVDVAKELRHGEALDINWGAAKKYGPRVFLVLWHNLGGFQATFWGMKDNQEEKNAKSQDEVDQGYDLLEQCPKQTRGNKQAR